jgi:hypothetical protein
MANYYEMMRDTVGAWGEGVDHSRRRRAEDEMRERQRMEFEQRQRDWAEQNEQRQEVKSAMGGLRAMQGGIYDGQQTDWGSLPANSDAGPTQPPASGLQPRTATPPRPASDMEMNQAAQRVALAQRDMGAWGKLEGDNRSLKLTEGRRAEVKRLNSLKDQELVGIFQQSINANPDMPAMVDFDPKSRKYVVVSQVPGIPTQVLSRAEMVQSMMGVWEMGNGDYNAGIAAAVGAAQASRAMADKNFERSRGMAGDNAGLYFQGRQADNADARLGMEGARLGLARDEAKHRRESERAGTPQVMSDGKGGIVLVTPVKGKDGVVEFRQAPMPAGLKPYNDPRTARDPLQEKLAAGYADEVAAARKPADVTAVQNKYRQLGLKGIGEDPILEALRKATGGGGEAAPGGVRVPGRPLYEAPTPQLQQMARKPRGVSSQEAAAAMDELERRKGESRMSAY